MRLTWPGRPGQPLAQQRVDVRRTQLVADRLQGGRVGDRGEPVVQCLEGYPGPAGLPLRPVIAVDARPGAAGEAGAELEEERAGIGVHGIDVEVFTSPVVPTIHGQDTPSRSRRFPVRNSAVFSCARPMDGTPSVFPAASKTAR
jgi:hypothetical protein